MYESGKLTVDGFMSGLVKRNPGETEFHQAVHEVAETVIPYINKNVQSSYLKSKIPDSTSWSQFYQ